MCRQFAEATARYVWLALSKAGPLTRLGAPKAPVVVMVCLTAMLFALPAEAFESRLRVPESGTFPPSGPLEVFIPADVPDEQLARLHLVIDGVDQRTRIEVRGDYARLVPTEPLTAGAHQLDLVELMPDGSVVSHGSWEFTVAGDAALSGGTVRYAGSVSATSNTAGTFLDNTGAPTVASDGTLDAQGRAQGDSFQAGAYLPFIYNSTNQTLGTRAVEIANYLFDIKGGPVSAFAGHHNIEYDNVLMQNGLARRGVSGRLDLTQLKSHLSVFEMQSSAASGFDNFLGLDDRNDRVAGVAAATSPVDTDDFGMDVTFSYVDGRDPQLAPGTASVEPRREAQTWGVSTTLKFLKNTLSVRGDFAHSDFSIPTDPAVKPENGDTYKLAVAWSPETPVKIFGDDASFTLGTDYYRYSTFFANPANTFDNHDQEHYGAVAKLTADEWNLGATFGQVYDNVDDSPLLGRGRARTAGFEFGYTPAAEQDAEGNVSYGWLGNPTYNLIVNWSDSKTVEAPRMGTPGVPVDFLDGDATARLDFDKGTWTWGVSYNANLHDDRQVGESNLTHTAGAQASITFTKIGLSLNPSLQYILNDLDGSRPDDTAVNGNFTAAYAPTNIPITANLIFNFSRSASSDDTVDTNIWTTQADVGWIALDGSGSWPSLLLTLAGTHQYTDDQTPTGMSSESYTAYLRASIQWSRTYGTQ